MTEIKAPTLYGTDFPARPTIFLAGSIEMGAAVDWQKDFAEFLAEEECLLLNPRRDEWDPSWEQDITNDKYVEQVMWELRAMEDADLIVMYFAPSTKSPITLLELGLNAREDKPLLVCCPDEFWRKGNVEIVCGRYDVPMLPTLEHLKHAARVFVRTFG